MSHGKAESFGDRVAAAVKSHGPLCAGIDPSRELLIGWGLAATPVPPPSIIATT